MLSDLNATTISTTANHNGTGGCPPVGIQLEGVILPPVLIIDIALGFLGNATALWIFCFKQKAWKPNNLFLFSLVIADFLALVSLPLRVDSLLRGHWVFGDVMCHVHFFLMLTSRTASIALMTVVTIYRYFKVVRPHHRFNRMTRRQAALVLVFVWFLAMISRVPVLVFAHLEESGEKTQCFILLSYNDKSQAITILFTILLERIIPLVILLFCSIRIFSFLRKRQMGKCDKVRKAMRVCIIIAMVFIVCYLPSTVTKIGVLMLRLFPPMHCSTVYTFTQLHIAFFGWTFLNSVLNPIIYVFSSSMFRKTLLAVLPCTPLCGLDADKKTTFSSAAQARTQQQEMSSARIDRGRIFIS